MLNRAGLSYFMLAAISTALVLAVFGIQGSVGFNLSDEGFLWYGVQRVMVGEIPIRDFMSYDPGRYYWSAALMRLCHDNGIMALRWSVATFQIVGLFIGLVLLVRNFPKSNIFLWSLSVITLIVWMYPRHKLFDISLSIALVGILSFLVQQPTSRRYFLTGLFIGIVALFGRNHGMYGVAGSIGVMAYLTIRREDSPTLLKAFSIWVSGVVIGYTPILLMIGFVPGFALAFWESIRLLFEIKATNLPLPLPWPWLVSFSQTSTIEIIRGVLIGSFFITLVIFGLLGIAWVIRAKLQSKSISPVLVASVFLVLPYAHYAYSRADIPHLAQGIFPFLLGSLVLIANLPEKIKWLLSILLCGASLFVMLPLQPEWRCYSSKQCIETDVSGSKLKVDIDTANNLAMLNKLASDFAPEDRSLIVAPLWPGAYAVLGRKSPMWDIYALFPHSATFQQAEIERIKAANPGFAVIYDAPLDGRDDLRFRNTHPIIDQYIHDHFEPLNGYSPNSAFQIYTNK